MSITKPQKQELARSFRDLILESPQIKASGMSQDDINKKINAFIDDTRRAHYLDEFIRILLNPDTLKVINPPHNYLVNTTTGQNYTVKHNKIGYSDPLPGSDPLKSSGFIKGTIEKYGRPDSKLGYKDFSVSQVESDKDSMVESLRMIIEPTDKYPLNFILEFTFPNNIKGSEISFKICDKSFNAVHHNPLVFRIDRSKHGARSQVINSFPKDKCRERSSDYYSTGQYKFHTKEQIDDHINNYFK